MAVKGLREGRGLCPIATDALTASGRPANRMLTGMLHMDKYAPFVWAAWGISAVGLIGISVRTILEKHRLAARLRVLEKREPTAPDHSPL